MADDEAKRKALAVEFAKLSNSGERWCWAPSDTEAYIEGKFVKEHKDGSFDVELKSGPVTVPAAAAKDLKEKLKDIFIPRLSDISGDYEDMVRMSDVNEATILRNLKLRFSVDRIYTNIGTILVAMNPFKKIDGIYSDARVQEHLNTTPGEASAPHVFQTAAAAYLGVRGERVDQAIIISGESGAGKTEATKQCLSFFASAAGSSNGSMSEKLLSANPVLEAFGNAKTTRNNNSSRFGKWMEVHFNGRAQVCASRIQNYLLEKSRIVFQTKFERNYHIFYQLCVANIPAHMRAMLRLGRPEDYGYTKHSSITADGLNDDHEFKDVTKSFAALEFTEADYLPMYRIVAGLLHMSNVDFTEVDADSCAVSDAPEARKGAELAAELMGMKPDELRKALSVKLIETNGERIAKLLSAPKAYDCRNSLAKAIYGRMFSWLVGKVNESMDKGLPESKNIIGVLDIFGFEIFESNSFEQLCAARARAGRARARARERALISRPPPQASTTATKSCNSTSTTTFSRPRPSATRPRASSSPRSSSSTTRTCSTSSRRSRAACCRCSTTSAACPTARTRAT